jgi:hypothetical protein
MTDTTPLDSVRYPAGSMPRLVGSLDRETRAGLVDAIAALPGRIRALVDGVSEEALSTTYRPGGWTIRQVVHHLPDSHINAYVRQKLAATEETPRIVLYKETLWAELPEAKSGPIDLSLALLDALHARWTAFLRSLTEEQLRRAFDHPKWGPVTIEETLLWYEWHGRHHAAHIEQALKMLNDSSRSR